ncbi:hypothetical protein [Legionella nautarum]|nr:hypothetical protein [Legionella nautarum]
MPSKEWNRPTHPGQQSPGQQRPGQHGQGQHGQTQRPNQNPSRKG